MRHIISTSRQSECEYCGEMSKKVFPVFDRHIRACNGEHAYKAHRQEKMIELLFENAAKNFKLRVEAMGGQGLVEYSLILALVSVVVIVILSILGPAVGNIFSSIVMGI